MPAPECGEPTNVCRQCRHHHNCHKAEGRACKQYPGPRPPCKHATELFACETFAAAPCTNKSVMQNGYCRLHNGNALKGIAHPNYQGKGYSKYLPESLREDFEAHAGDPEWLSLRNELDLLRTHLSGVLKDMQAGHTISDDVHDGFKAFSKAYSAAMLAQKTGNAEKFAEAMNAIGMAKDDMGQALGRHASTESARMKSVQLTIAIDRLSRSENSKRLTERGLISLEAVMSRDDAMLRAWKEALDGQVLDAAVRKAVLTAVGRIYSEFVGRREAPGLTAGGDAVVVEAEYSASTDR